jgi:hypothetical protein
VLASLFVPQMATRVAAVLAAAAVLTACGAAQVSAPKAAAPEIKAEELSFSQVRVQQVPRPNGLTPVVVALAQLHNNSKFWAHTPLIGIEYLDAAGKVIHTSPSVQTPFRRIPPGGLIVLMDTHLPESTSETPVDSVRLTIDAKYGVGVAEGPQVAGATVAIDERSEGKGGVYLKGTLTITGAACMDPQVTAITRNKKGELASYYGFRVHKKGSVGDMHEPGTEITFTEGVPVFGDGELPHELFGTCHTRD